MGRLRRCVGATIVGCDGEQQLHAPDMTAVDARQA